MRLLAGKKLVDLEGWNGIDSGIEDNGQSGRGRSEELAQFWKGSVGG